MAPTSARGRLAATVPATAPSMRTSTLIGAAVSGSMTQPTTCTDPAAGASNTSTTPKGEPVGTCVGLHARITLPEPAPVLMAVMQTLCEPPDAGTTTSKPWLGPYNGKNEGRSGRAPPAVGVATTTLSTLIDSETGAVVSGSM